MGKFGIVFLLFAFVCNTKATSPQCVSAADELFKRIVVYDQESKKPMQANAFELRHRRLNLHYMLSFARPIDILEEFKHNLEIVERNPCGKSLLNRINTLINVIEELEESTHYGFDGKIHITLNDADGINFMGYAKIIKKKQI